MRIGEKHVLYFHSNRCLAKFFKRMVEDNPEEAGLKKLIMSTAKDFEAQLRSKKEKAKKLIA